MWIVLTPYFYYPLDVDSCQHDTHNGWLGPANFSLLKFWWDPVFQIAIRLHLSFQVLNFPFEDLRYIFYSWIVLYSLYTYVANFWQILCYFLLFVACLFFESLICGISWGLYTIMGFPRYVSWWPWLLDRDTSRYFSSPKVDLWP